MSLDADAMLRKLLDMPAADAGRLVYADFVQGGGGGDFPGWLRSDRGQAGVEIAAARGLAPEAVHQFDRAATAWAAFGTTMGQAAVNVSRAFAGTAKGGTVTRLDEKGRPIK